MRGITIDNMHTGDDWGLILNAKQIDPPTPKIYTVAVDGRDGEIDLSEALTGTIQYENRNASFTFIASEGTYQDREDLLMEIMGTVHGKRLKIFTDDDPDHYLIGRWQVKDISNNAGYATFTITASCDPWRYAVNVTKYAFNVRGVQIYAYVQNNGFKRQIPLLTVQGSITIKKDTISHTLTDGSYKLMDLPLEHGLNIWTLEGTGTLSIEFTEGVL